ncbi:Sorting nexin mvp1 [Dimargaris verticillata]|uniref:Sorting nexin MVP1 n=1 Tax=Dimargaris verticillata TaxID=2761393 RepID=A0A9W8B865_9FUNG|nr:Sorting nexin mvp1 [Dimargaris verticillata]
MASPPNSNSWAPDALSTPESALPSATYGENLFAETVNGIVPNTTTRSPVPALTRADSLLALNPFASSATEAFAVIPQPVALTSSSIAPSPPPIPADTLDWLNPWGPSTSTQPLPPPSSSSSAGLWARVCLDRKELPPVYAEAFQAAQPRNDRVTAANLRQVLTATSGLTPKQIMEVITIVTTARRASSGLPHPTTLGIDSPELISRTEHDVVLALVAMAQKHMILSLDNLIAHKHDLPVPLLPGLDTISLLESQRRSKSAMFSFPLKGDWWRPRRKQNQSHDDLASQTLDATGDTKVAPNQGSVVQKKATSDNNRSSSSSSSGGGSGEDDPWHIRIGPTPWQNAAAGAFNNAIPNAPGMDESQQPSPAGYEEPLPSLAPFSQVADDPVQITIDDVRSGTVFKYTTYTLVWNAKAARVIRRYSDFWWLLEALMKHYPFRMLPHLPPKAIGANDPVFLETRRQGLVRFTGFLVRHPVLGQDRLLTDFLTVESTWTKYRRTMTLPMESEHLRADLDLAAAAVDQGYANDTFVAHLGRIREQLQLEIDRLHHQCLFMEVIGYQQHNLAQEVDRFSAYFRTLGEAVCAQPQCAPCTRQAAHLQIIKEQFCTASALTADHAKLTSGQTLDYLRRYLGVSVAFQELLNRYERQDLNKQIDKLTRKIKDARQRLDRLRNSPKINNSSSQSSNIKATNGNGRDDDPGHGSGEDSTAAESQASSMVQQDEAQLRRLKYQHGQITRIVASEYQLYHRSRAFITELHTQYTDNQATYHQRMQQAWQRNATL